jgi:hypothetical protein
LYFDYFGVFQELAMTISQDKAKAAVEWITDYLTSGGFFNPEYMDHQKVSNWLLEHREFLRPLAAGTHVMVPVEPTEKMIEAWSTTYPKVGQEFNDKNCATADWQAMITSSQEQE